MIKVSEKIPYGEDLLNFSEKNLDMRRFLVYSAKRE